MKRPDSYDWWIDSIQDCLCQIAGRFNAINPRSNACRHVCDETYADLSHFVDCVRSNGFVDVPTEQWNVILELSEGANLETLAAVSKANMVLDSAYFRERPRWPYGG
jgi:hypothetical protein